jgi:hypothetical protein
MPLWRAGLRRFESNVSLTPFELCWFVMPLQPPALWLLMAMQRGLQPPEWRFPLKGRWLRYLAWGALLGPALFRLGALCHYCYPFLLMGVVAWVVEQAMLTLLSVGAFAMYAEFRAALMSPAATAPLFVGQDDQEVAVVPIGMARKHFEMSRSRSDPEDEEQN